MDRSAWQGPQRIAMVAVAYFAAAVLGGWLSAPTSFATFWPPNGVLLAALLGSPRRMWPALILATGPANVAFNLLQGHSSAINLAYWCVNVGEAYLAAAVLTSPAVRVRAVRCPRDVLALTVTAAGAAAVAAVLGAAVTGISPTPLPFHRAWRMWWAADLLGLLAVTPVAIPWFARRTSDDVAPARAEMLAFVALCAILTVTVAIDTLAGSGRLVQPILVIIPLGGWAALRLGVSATSWAVLVVASVSILRHVHGIGALLLGTPYTPDVAFVLQTILCGIAVTFLAIAAAIEVHRRADRAAHRRDDERDLLVRTITHEIRNPVATILGGVELVRDADQSIGLTDRAAGFQMIERAARQILSLVDQVLALGRGAAVPLRSTRCWLPALWRDLHAECAALPHGHDVVLHWSEPVPDATLDTDRERLQMIVRNLVSNALKYTDRGTVSVSCSVRDGRFVFLVEDTGIGIPAADRERVFALYDRGGSSAATRRPGTGIGLYVVRQFAEQLGGRVVLHSEVGIGTRITVDLPLGDARSAAAG